MKMVVVILAMLILMTGCAPLKSDTSQQETEVKAEYMKITPEEAKEKMGQEGVLVVDVRTQEEYDGGHIEGAILLPVDQIKDKAPQVLPDKSSVILVYCRSGNRSRTASKALIDMGYMKVLDFGGIKDWPYETVK